MPVTEVLLYQEQDGTIPVLDWLKDLQRTNPAAFQKCLFLLDLLSNSDTNCADRGPTCCGTAFTSSVRRCETSTIGCCTGS